MIISKTLIKRRKKTIIYFLRIKGSSFEQIWIPFTLEYFVQNWVEIGPVVLDKKNFNSVNVFYYMYFVIISPSFEQLKSPSPKDALFKVWLKLA